MFTVEQTMSFRPQWSARLDINVILQFFLYLLSAPMPCPFPLFAQEKKYDAAHILAEKKV